jgi:hypothetical protein
MSVTQKRNAESAVRLYLLYLEDPSKLRDETEIQKKTRAVRDATDPIDKLKALAELERVAMIHEEPFREGFVQHAKAWATEQGVPTSAFQELKVPDDTLRQAGFDVPRARRRGRGTATPEGRPRAKAVPVQDIKTYILNQKGTFVLTDVMSGIGGSQATVRKAVDELIEAGLVEKLGPVPGYSGRGRAPLQYAHS